MLNVLKKTVNYAGFSLSCVVIFRLTTSVRYQSETANLHVCETCYASASVRILKYGIAEHTYEILVRLRAILQYLQKQKKSFSVTPPPPLPPFVVNDNAFRYRFCVVYCVTLRSKHHLPKCFK